MQCLHSNLGLILGIGSVSLFVFADAALGLYLPDEHGCLVRSDRICFNDSPWSARRIDTSKVSFVHPSVSFQLCRAVGVRPLSQAIQEALISLEEEIDNSEAVAEGEGEGKARRQQQPPLSAAGRSSLQALLRSPQFAAGVCRLWEDQAARDQDYAGWLAAPAADAVAAALSAYSLRFVRRIATRLLLLPESELAAAAAAAAAGAVAVDAAVAVVEVAFTAAVPVRAAGGASAAALALSARLASYRLLSVSSTALRRSRSCDISRSLASIRPRSCAISSSLACSAASLLAS